MATKRKAKVARKAGPKAQPKTKKIGGKTYTKTSCSKSKTDAKKRAERLRKQGYNARIVRDNKNKSWCTFKAGRKKAKRA